MEDYQSMDFAPVGTQVGLDPKKLGRLWNALANLALHIAIPERKDATVPQYGEASKVEAKVIEALNEIKRISAGTLISSGFGEEISFECVCGAKNRRRLSLLQDRQTISCINPECLESFDYDERAEAFERRTYEIVCRRCQGNRRIPKKMVERLRTDQHIYFDCECCHEKISVQWRLMQAQKSRPG